jgi:hypothetical protein
MSAVDLSALTITISDARKAGYCVSGIRRWWPNQRFPVSFAAFLRDGIAADTFIAGGDDHARNVVEQRLARDAATGQEAC